MKSEENSGRLILLGGGIASLTAAFHASAPGHRDVFPRGIHVYEKTAMLGGKGASRRNSSAAVADRIEEHGLHVWFGSYDNAFALLAECHAYLDREAQRHQYKRWSSSLRDMEAGFRPCSRVALMDHDGAGWLPWVADFPEDPSARPWHARAPEEKLTSPSELAVRALRLAEAFLHSIGGKSITGGKPKSVFLDIEDVPMPLRPPRIPSLSDTFDRLLSSAETATSAETLGPALRVLARVSTELRNRFDEPVRRHPSLRRGWQLVDLLLAAVRGLINDGVVSTGDFSLIDDLDLRAWLVFHGASQESVSCGLLTALAYDLPFAYEAGNPEKPRISAAVGLYGLFRILLTYRGAIMWKMNAGMGEVVFAPIYEALIRRGVEFHFGYEVQKIHLQDDGERQRADRITFKRAPSFLAKERLDVVSVETGPLAGDLPYWTTALSEGAVAEDIELGRNDMVVYGLPVGTIPTLLPDAPKRWRECGQKLKTVATGCVQLWLNAPVRRYAPWASPDITVGAYTEPFDTWADMHTLAGERYLLPVESVAYFCNVFPDDATDKTMNGEIDEFFDAHIAGLWPAYRPEMAVDQFRQLNNGPSSRYTLSLPGTLRARLSPREDSICNVRPVGDWTRNSISAGSIESAVISGMLAAQLLRPDRPLTIFGENL